MTTDKLRDLLTARPFQPFLINLVDGRSLQVTHPESLSYKSGSRTFTYTAKKRTHVVDLLHMIDLEFDDYE